MGLPRSFCCCDGGDEGVVPCSCRPGTRRCGDGVEGVEGRCASRDAAAAPWRGNGWGDDDDEEEEGQDGGQVEADDVLRQALCSVLDMVGQVVSTLRERLQEKNQKEFANWPVW